MNVRALTVVLVLGVASLTALSSPASAAEAAASAKKRSSGIAYVPPLRGAPVSRVGGGTRSIKAADLQVEVLAPEHTGQTLREQPTLYWYSSRAIDAPVEFALVRPNVAEPVLEVTLPGPFAPGIHALDLAGLGARLAPGAEYEWFVSVVFDPAQRSDDVTAGARIQLIEPSDPVHAALAAKSADGAAYAAAGVWYDAIAALSANAAADETARTQRADLLDQVGLTDVAAAAR